MHSLAPPRLCPSLPPVARRSRSCVPFRSATVRASSRADELVAAAEAEAVERAAVAAAARAAAASRASVSAACARLWAESETLSRDASEALAEHRDALLQTSPPGAYAAAVAALPPGLEGALTEACLVELRTAVRQELSRVTSASAERTEGDLRSLEAAVEAQRAARDALATYLAGGEAPSWRAQTEDLLTEAGLSQSRPQPATGGFPVGAAFGDELRASLEAQSRETDNLVARFSERLRTGGQEQ